MSDTGDGYLDELTRRAAAMQGDGLAASASKERACQWCGFVHILPGVCPQVKAFEYYSDGTLKRVELR